MGIINPSCEVKSLFVANEASAKTTILTDFESIDLKGILANFHFSIVQLQDLVSWHFLCLASSLVRI